VCHLRGAGTPVSDAGADQVVQLADGPLPQVVPRVLGALDPALADDGELVTAVVADAERLGGATPGG
jgi:fructuronate reductase